MGTLVGHVAPGFGFFIIGLWHLFNHIKLHAQRPSSYTAPPWFPAKLLRHLELYLIMIGSCISIAMELFIGPARHQPLDDDWTIPSDHLHNFEHSSISFTFLVYAAFALVFDRMRPRAAFELTQVLGAVAFSQQLLMFHLHSADHMGVEGQYHLLLQAAIVVSLATTLMSIGFPKSFTVSFVRSASIMFQGAWLMLMGFVLWTPAFVFKGCFMNMEDGHIVVRCHGDAALHRAKSLVNIQFSWFLAGTPIFSVLLYLYLTKKYLEETEYVSLGAKEAGEADQGLESQMKQLEENQSFIHMGKGFRSLDLESSGLAPSARSSDCMWMYTKKLCSFLFVPISLTDPNLLSPWSMVICTRLHPRLVALTSKAN
ncbi:hypothetical protein Taro_046098 [Colocasia esculenta]|uniref:Uncharacterized protein n=1 Tax=Colocasia esculenta TaxID=4460 RepID=A0A843X558_COLES|nr:hypothetical protein [Colocasia esculenta]